MNEKTDNPLITVAMPVYNAGNYLRPAVMSILAQTYPNWELLVIDDKSTDGSLESIADISDARITILSDGFNKGLAARLNQAIDQARGQFLARMDQDDISYPERFAKQLALLVSAPELDLVAVRAIRISEENEVLDFFPSPLTHGEICARPWQGFYFPHPTWMGRIAWFRKYRYRVPQSYFCEDQELLLRSYCKSKFACVPEVQFAYRVRARINLKRLLRTRWAMFKLQFLHFRAKREFQFVLFALGIFVSRIVIDLTKLIKQHLALGAKIKFSNMKLHSEARQWERLKLQFFSAETDTSSR